MFLIFLFHTMFVDRGLCVKPHGTGWETAQGWPGSPGRSSLTLSQPAFNPVAETSARPDFGTVRKPQEVFPIRQALQLTDS